MKSWMMIVCCILSGHSLAEGMVKLSNLNDINFGNFQGSGDIIGLDDFCLFRDDPGTLTLSATGSGNNNAFTLSSGSHSLTYQVQFTDELSMPDNLVSGVALTGIPNSNTTEQTCSTIGNNVSIELRILEQDARQAQAGSYTGMLFLTIAPE